MTLLTRTPASMDPRDRITNLDVDVYLEATAGAVGRRVGFCLDGGISRDQMGETPLTWAPATEFERAGNGAARP